MKKTLASLLAALILAAPPWTGIASADPQLRPNATNGANTGEVNLGAGQTGTGDRASAGGVTAEGLNNGLSVSPVPGVGLPTSMIAQPQAVEAAGSEASAAPGTRPGIPPKTPDQMERRSQGQDFGALKDAGEKFLKPETVEQLGAIQKVPTQAVQQLNAPGGGEAASRKVGEAFENNNPTAAKSQDPALPAADKTLSAPIPASRTGLRPARTLSFKKAAIATAGVLLAPAAALGGTGSAAPHPLFAFSLLPSGWGWAFLGVSTALTVMAERMRKKYGAGRKGMVLALRGLAGVSGLGVLFGDKIVSYLSPSTWLILISSGLATAALFRVFRSGLARRQRRGAVLLAIAALFGAYLGASFNRPAENQADVVEVRFLDNAPQVKTGWHIALPGWHKVSRYDVSPELKTTKSVVELRTADLGVTIDSHEGGGKRILEAVELGLTVEWRLDADRLGVAHERAKGKDVYEATVARRVRERLDEALSEAIEKAGTEHLSLAQRLAVARALSNGIDEDFLHRLRVEEGVPVGRIHVSVDRWVSGPQAP